MNTVLKEVVFVYVDGSIVLTYSGDDSNHIHQTLPPDGNGYYLTFGNRFPSDTTSCFFGSLDRI